MSEAKCLKCGRSLGVGGAICPNKECASCFTAATKVLSPAGWKTIETFRVGDEIISFDKNSHSLISQTVRRKNIHAENTIWEVETEHTSNPISTTAKHNFCTDRGWKKTMNLNSGDSLIAVNNVGEIFYNEVFSVKKTCRFEKVYNLVVDGPNTFLVEGSVVHSFSYFKNLRGLLVNMFGQFSSASSDPEVAYIS